MGTKDCLWTRFWFSSRVAVTQRTLVVLMAIHHLLNSLPAFRSQIPSVLCSWAPGCARGSASPTRAHEASVRVSGQRCQAATKHPALWIPAQQRLC